MVRKIDRVVTSGDRYVYVLDCGHSLIAYDYKPKRGMKEFAWCEPCWQYQKHEPTGDHVRVK